MVIIYKGYRPPVRKDLAFPVIVMRVRGPVLSCLKGTGMANIFSPFSFLKPPPIVAPLSHSFYCYIPLSILQFWSEVRYYAGGNGLWERKESHKNVAWQSSCLVKIRSNIISEGTQVYGIQQAGSGAARPVAREMWAVLCLFHAPLTSI